MRRLFRVRVRSLLIAVAAVAICLSAAFESRRRATRALRSFHAAKARDYRELADRAARSSAEWERRAALGVPSEAGYGYVYQGGSRMLKPEEWAGLSKGLKETSALFRTMADDQTRWLEKLERSVYHFWEPLPQDPWEGEAAAQASR